MFNDELKQVITAIQNSNDSNINTNVSNVINNNKNKWEKEFQELYFVIAQRFAQDTFNEVERKKEIKKLNIWNNDTIDFIQNKTVEQVGRIRETTKDELKYIILKGLDEDKNTDEIAQDIRRRYKHFGKVRSETIAVTEVTSISNYGSIMGAMESSVELLKTWVTVGDKRVRDTHSVMDDYPPIEMTEEFQVGNSLMMYPGDPNGESKEVIRCRCALDYINK